MTEQGFSELHDPTDPTEEFWTGKIVLRQN